MYSKTIIVGRLGSDPEVRYTQAGDPVGNLSVATNERWVDKSGEKQERTEWHKVVIWGKSAENCQKYLKSGSLVMVEGTYKTNKWQDKEGNDRYTQELHTSNVQFLDSKKSTDGGGGSLPPAEDDDIPF